MISKCSHSSLLGWSLLWSELLQAKKTPFLTPMPCCLVLTNGYLACALRDVPRAQRPVSIPQFIATWGVLPLSEWCVKLEVPVDFFTPDDRLLDSDCDGSPTALCHKLSRGEAMGREAFAEHGRRAYSRWHRGWCGLLKGERYLERNNSSISTIHSSQKFWVGFPCAGFHQLLLTEPDSCWILGISSQVGYHHLELGQPLVICLA